MYRSQVCAETAQNATETVKTTITTPFLVPQGCNKISGVAVQINSAGLTTLEDTTALLELECNDASVWDGTQQFLVQGMGTALTSGTAYLPVQIIPAAVRVSSGAHIYASMTFNNALTVNPSWRVQLIFE